MSQIQPTLKCLNFLAAAPAANVKLHLPCSEACPCSSVDLLTLLCSSVRQEGPNVFAKLITTVMTENCENQPGRADDVYIPEQTPGCLKLVATRTSQTGQEGHGHPRRKPRGRSSAADMPNRICFRVHGPYGKPPSVSERSRFRKVSGSSASFHPFLLWSTERVDVAQWENSTSTPTMMAFYRKQHAVICF